MTMRNWGSVGIRIRGNGWTPSYPSCESYVEVAKSIDEDYRAHRISLDEAIRRLDIVVRDSETAPCSGTIWNYNRTTILSISSALQSESTIEIYRETRTTYEAMGYVFLAAMAVWALVELAD